MKYRIINERKKQDIKMFTIMEKTRAQREEGLWKDFCRNYKEEYGEDIDVAKARERYEMLVNGVARLKPTEREKKDMLEKEASMDPVSLDEDDI